MSQRAPLCCTSTPPSTPLNVHRARVRRKRGRLRSHGSAILGQRSVSHASRLCTGFPPETEGCDTQRRAALQQCNLSPTIIPHLRSLSEDVQLKQEKSEGSSEELLSRDRDSRDLSFI